MSFQRVISIKNYCDILHFFIHIKPFKHCILYLQSISIQTSHIPSVQHHRQLVAALPESTPLEKCLAHRKWSISIGQMNE